MEEDWQKKKPRLVTLGVVFGVMTRRRASGVDIGTCLDAMLTFVFSTVVEARVADVVVSISNNVWRAILSLFVVGPGEATSVHFPAFVRDRVHVVAVVAVAQT